MFNDVFLILYLFLEIIGLNSFVKIDGSVKYSSNFPIELNLSVFKVLPATIVKLESFNPIYSFIVVLSVIVTLPEDIILFFISIFPLRFLELIRSVAFFETKYLDRLSFASTNVPSNISVSVV